MTGEEQAAAVVAGLRGWRAFDATDHPYSGASIWIWDGRTAYYYNTDGARGLLSGWVIGDVNGLPRYEGHWQEIAVPAWFHGHDG